ncbi:MAG: hypothetical protein ACRDYW_05915 [Acidimicrobiales bacterium]
MTRASEPTSASGATQEPEAARRWRGPLALALLFVAVVGPVVQEYTAPTAPRYALAAALWEHGTIELDRYDAIVFVDRLELDGHLYSDKAPGQPFMSVPAYALATALGADPALELRVRGDLGVWSVTAWSSLVPAVALVLLMAKAARRMGEQAALVGAAGVAFGTLVLPYSAQLYGHLLGSALGFGAWRLLWVGAPTVRRTLAAGLLAGLAVTVEYQLAVVVLVLVGWILIRHPRRILPFAIGGLPAAAALAAYQWALLGSPFSSSYSQKPAHEEASPVVTGIPDPIQALEILFGSRGVLLFTPIVACGIWGLVRLAREDRGARDEAIVGLVVFGGFFLLQAGWPNPWGGEMPGPRYLIPALPFLALGIARAWTGAPRLVAALLAVSAFSMSWPLLARHLVPDGGWLIESQLTDVNIVGFMPTLFTMSLGALGWVVHAGLVVAAARHLERVARQQDRPATGSPTPAVGVPD